MHAVIYPRPKGVFAKMKKLFLSLLLTSVFISGACAQTETPESVREQAYGKIKVAGELTGRAANFLVPGQSKENLATAIQLYVQAGQLFEQAGNMLKALGTDYVPQSDIDNCNNATQSCINAIGNIKRIMGETGAAPAVPKTSRTLTSR